MASTKAKEIVSSNPVVVFSKTYCPLCVSVKKLLQEVGASFKAVELDTETTFKQHWQCGPASELRLMFSVAGSGKHIGGCDTTTAMHNEGKQIPLLTETGAVAKTSVSA